MAFNRQAVDYNLNITTQRLTNRSEGFTAVDYYKNSLPLNLLHKELSSTYRWRSGRSENGRIIMRTRGHMAGKNRHYSINYHFRDMRVSLLAGVLFAPLKNKLFSLVFLSSGSVTYTPTSSNHEVFRLLRFRSTLGKPLSSPVDPLLRSIPILQVFFVIHQLPKNKPVCLLEARPGRGVQYARAVGAKAILLKMDSRVSTSLVKLPSGVKKIFSMYGLGSSGTVALPMNKKMVNNKAGKMAKLGRKSTVRGVAMNPIDHPHGGRTKTLQHPRTPWGKTTKLK